MIHTLHVAGREKNKNKRFLVSKSYILIARALVSMRQWDKRPEEKEIKATKIMSEVVSFKQVNHVPFSNTPKKKNHLLAQQLISGCTLAIYSYGGTQPTTGSEMFQSL